MALSYKIVGEGPPLALLHGFGVSFSIWEQLAPLLSPHFQLIMIEMPGTGASPPPDPQRPFYDYAANLLENLRQELGTERWSLLGYSLGCWAGEAYLRMYPQRTQRALFLCPPFLRLGLAVGLRSVISVDRRRPAFGDWLISGWRLYWLVRLLGFNLRRHPHARVWTHEISSQAPAHVKAWLYGLENGRRGQFSLGPLPVRYIWGKRDLIAPPPRRLAVNDVVIAADHSAPVDAAPAVAAAALSFLLDTTLPFERLAQGSWAR